MLRDEQVLLLNILKESLRGESYELESPDNDSFVRLMRLAAEHQILPLVCEAVYQSESLRKNTLFSSCKQKAITNAAIQVIRTDEFLRLYQGLQNIGIHPMVVKGTVCQKLYPRPLLRTSVDDDLFLPREQFAACHQYFLDQGLKPDRPVEDINTADEISYHREDSPLYIELHRNLFPADSEAYGSFNRFFEHAADHAVMTEIQDTQVRTLCPTDHLLFLILHAFKHFLHSGIGIRPVCDIGMFADHYHKEIDWNRIREALRESNAFDCTRALFHILNQYLLPEAAFMTEIQDWRINEIETEPLLLDILESGTLGDSSVTRLHSSNYTLNAVTGGKQRSGLLHSIFLPLNSMKGSYPYLNKAPFLLPAAWIQRILAYLKELKQTSSDDAIESIVIGRGRLKLLERYNVIKNNIK